MSEKSLYKKLVDTWLDDDKTQQRGRENRFYEKANADKVGVKSKSKAKPKPRADHKHKYIPVVIWRNSWNNEVYGRVDERCRICGKVKENCFSFYRRNELCKFYGDMEHFREENDKLTPIDRTTYRKTIFLFDSLTSDSLTLEVKNKLVDFMNLGYVFAVGGRKTKDFAIQNFLFVNGYRNVVVYYSGDNVGINLSGWNEKKLSAKT